MLAKEAGRERLREERPVGNAKHFTQGNAPGGRVERRGRPRSRGRDGRSARGSLSAFVASKSPPFLKSIFSKNRSNI